MTERNPLPESDESVRLLQAKARAVYGRNSRACLEEQWILETLPMVKRIVQKVAGHLVRRDEMEDLVSSATLGLVKAARSFDPSRDAAFKTYAYIRIRGAVLDELRGRSFTPSNVVQQIAQVRRAYMRLTVEGTAPPSDETLAAELGISTEQLYRTLQEARRQHFLCIHGLSDDQSAMGQFIPVDPAPSPDEDAQRKEMVEALAQAITRLAQRERHVLLMYYREDLTMKEIAEVLQVTESRVSQIHSSALFKLSMMLDANNAATGLHVKETV